FLYLVAAGYCVALAALLYGTLTYFDLKRPVVIGVVALILVAGIGLSWMQLRPWNTASAMSDDLIEQLHRAIPSQPGSQANGLVWYAQDVPATYQGAYVMLQGLEEQ